MTLGLVPSKPLPRSAMFNGGNRIFGDSIFLNKIATTFFGIVNFQNLRFCEYIRSLSFASSVGVQVSFWRVGQIVRQPLPCLAFLNAADKRIADAHFLSQVNTWHPGFKNFYNLMLLQSTSGVFAPSKLGWFPESWAIRPTQWIIPIPSFLHFIQNVVLICAQEKMLRISASWVVAFMENLHSFWNFSIKSFVGKFSGFDINGPMRRHDRILVNSVYPQATPIPAPILFDYLKIKIAIKRAVSSGADTIKFLTAEKAEFYHA